MEKKRKNIILLIIGILILAILIIMSVVYIKNKKLKEDNGNSTAEKYVEVLEDGTKLNTSNQFKKVKDIDGFKISEAELKNMSSQSILTAKVTNETGSDTKEKFITIIFYDESKNELGRGKGIIPPIVNNESKEINVSLQTDYSNAYDFDFIID